MEGLQKAVFVKVILTRVEKWFQRGWRTGNTELVSNQLAR
jgi:hypothetical protein